MEPSIILIANPASGKVSLKKIKEAETCIASKRAAPEVLLTSKKGDATRLAQEAVDKNPDIIIAAGGDGTVNEAVNGMAGSDVPLALLPLGTTNVLARELGIPGTVKGAVDAALGLKARPVSLGRITAGGQTRYFCFASGIGFDASTVLGAREWAKKITGRAAYVLSAVNTLMSWNPEELTVKADGKEYSCYSLIASNTRKYAGDFIVAPDADIAEPHLHLLLFHGRRRLDIIRYVRALLIHRLSSAKGVAYLKCREFEVKGIAHIQVDGDYLGTSPASVSVVPEAVKIIY
jgi:YegS/Rv2252/BmrU family lipid kinase